MLKIKKNIYIASKASASGSLDDKDQCEFKMIQGGFFFFFYAASFFCRGETKAVGSRRLRWHCGSCAQTQRERERDELV